jgi:P27 family predicted phage terminase small subunit
MPGPPPKPTELKILEGNPGKQKLKRNHMKPERVLGLKCPKFIGKYGKQEWNRITTELARLGLLTKLDQGALEMYCRMYQKWRENEDFCIEKGTVFTYKEDDVLDSNGKVVKKGKIKHIAQLPHVSIAMQCAEFCRKMLGEFGLTPAQRSKIEIKDKDISQEDLDEMESYCD